MDIMKKLNIQLGEDEHILMEIMRSIAQDHDPVAHYVYTSRSAQIDLSERDDDEYIETLALEHASVYVKILSSVIPAIEDKTGKPALIDATLIASAMLPLFLHVSRGIPSKKAAHHFAIARTDDTWSFSISVYARVGDGYVHSLTNTWTIVAEVLPVSNKQ